MEEAIAELVGHDSQSLLHICQKLDPHTHLSTHLQSNVRPSSRPLHAVRQTSILPSILTRNTAGSALIRLGDTVVIAGTTLQIGRPSPSHPRHGEVEVSLTLNALCSPRYGMSSRIVVNDTKSNADRSVDAQKSIESWLNRTLQSCHVVDLEGLSIEDHKAAWKVRVKILVLNHDGNIEDAAFLAAVAALKDTRLPQTKTVRNERGDNVVCLLHDQANSTTPGTGTSLQLNCLPIPLTVGLFPTDNDEYKMLVDPTSQEENVLGGLLTIVVALTTEGKEPSEGKIKLLSVNKPGGKVVVKAQDIAACMQLCRGRALEVAPMLTQVGA